MSRRTSTELELRNGQTFAIAGLLAGTVGLATFAGGTLHALPFLIGGAYALAHCPGAGRARSRRPPAPAPRP